MDSRIQSSAVGSERRGYLALFVAVTAISFAALFFKRSIPTDPLVAAAYRLAVSAIFFAPFVIRAHRRGVMGRRVLWHALGGGLMYAVHFGAWVWSLHLTSVAASVTLVTATPIFLALAGLVSGQDRPSWRHLLALSLTGIGLAVMAQQGGPAGSFTGNALALLGAAGMAGYLLLARPLGAIDVWAYSGVTTAIAALVLIIVAFIRDVSLVPSSQSAFLYLVAAALVCQVIGHSLLVWSLRFQRPVVVGIATVGEPVGATLIAWWFLGDGVGAPVLLGCSVILLGVLMAMGGGSSMAEDDTGSAA